VSRRAGHPELVGDGSVILGGFDHGDRGVVEVTELAREATDGSRGDAAGSEVSQIEQLAAQFAVELVLDEAVEERGEPTRELTRKNAIVILRRRRTPASR
jgi:hypothetical protein